MELGVATFGDADRDPHTGQRIPEAQAIRNIVEAVTLAEEVGLDWFGIGEHHTPEFPASAAAVILAAAGSQTSRIKLSSAVTVLGTDDPVRVYEQFATLDAISQGRAEIVAGRGSSIESFPLFGYDLAAYDQLYEEKLELLIAINNSERVTWSGTTRAPLNGEYIPPRAERGPIPLWLGAGGNPASAVRAARLGLPLATGVLAGDLLRNAPLVDLYRGAAAKFGNPPEITLVMLGSSGFIAEDGNAARDRWWPHYDRFMRTVGAQRGWVKRSRQDYDEDAAFGNAMLVGSPEEIADQIVMMHGRYGHVRHYMHMDWGALPQADHLRAIELLGTKVAPLVKAELGEASVDEISGRGPALGSDDAGFDGLARNEGAG